MNKKHWILLGTLVAIIMGAGVAIFALRSPAEKTATPTADTTTTSDTTVATTIAEPGNWKATGTAVEGSFADADTVKLADNSYRMYYAIQPEVQGNHFEVYSSTSTDGMSWTKEAGTRKTMATFPDVVKLTDGRFRMYFQSASVIKSAISTDGLTFMDEAGTRIDKTNDLGMTFDNVAAPTVMATADGSFVMVYRGTINAQYAGEVTPNKNTQLLLWATSTDGLTWIKKGLAIDSRSAPLYGLADGPELFDLADGSATSIRLSFWTYTGVYWSNFSVSDGTFTAPRKVFALAESTAMNKFPALTAGDPVYAKFNDVWYMYYGQKVGIDYAVAGK